MKKNVLALSITAALVGLTGGAHAMTGSLDGATAGTDLRLNGDGFGHFLFVPYFSTQDKNATLINIVNTDQTRGKAVKVRFRGAANSDDLFDFQVFLSPGDVWTANIFKNAAGLTQLTTSDNSCTKPDKATLNSTPFLTTRLDSTMQISEKANGTREGYVEIFNMGDIPKPLAGAAAVADVDYVQVNAGVDATAGATINPLYTAIKHVAATKTPPCSGAAWTFLDTNNLQWSAGLAAANTPRSAGLLPPTTGLVANWTIINVPSAAAWTGEAVAVQSVIALTGVASTGNVVYWPQTGALVGTGLGGIDLYSADPLLRTAKVAKYDAVAAAYVADATPGVAAGFFDLPDFSTPYVRGAGAFPYDADSPLFQAQSITASIAASAVTNEYLTDPTIVASTDWVISQPTRRYSIAFDYAATISATDDGRRFSDIVTKVGGAAGFVNGYFLQQNTLIGVNTNFNGRQICARNITPSSFDREETGVTAPTVVVISPSTPADPLSFCGEATVLSINNGGIVPTGTGSLKASVAVKDLDVGFRDGWLRLATPAAAIVAPAVNGLPLVGASFVRAFANSGTQSFGAAYNHRLSR